jgi:shikimate dehydrogenase
VDIVLDIGRPGVSFMYDISGTTRLLAIVGDPIEQVRAPKIWTALFRLNSVDAICVPIHVKPVDIRDFMRTAGGIKNLLGLIVTVPHKIVVFESSDIKTKRASQVGAANLVRWQADGTSVADHVDGVGFVNGLRARGHVLSNKRVLLVGCGGAGTAIAFATASQGCSDMAVFDPITERALNLVQRLEAAGFAAKMGTPIAEGFDVVINATPVGMRPDDPLPINCDGLHSGMLVADAIMKPPMTRLLTLAKERGCSIQPGTYMMDHQIPLSAEFFGLTPGQWSAEAVATLEQ